jgi:hypothetical protein
MLLRERLWNWWLGIWNFDANAAVCVRIRAIMQAILIPIITAIAMAIFWRIGAVIILAQSNEDEHTRILSRQDTLDQRLRVLEEGRIKMEAALAAHDKIIEYILHTEHNEHPGSYLNPPAVIPLPAPQR